MKIESINSNNPTTPKANKESTTAVKQNTVNTANEEKDQLIISSPKDKKATYNKPNVDKKTIEKLHKESREAYKQLREIVRQLLERQGMTFKDIINGKELEIDDTARLEAQELIVEGGPLSPEAVSDRIVDFAKALSGGDKEKIGLLRSAIEKGFEEARAMLGGYLPDISKETFNLVMEKLDAWENQ